MEDATMPRTSAARTTSALAEVQKHARRLLSNVRNAIRSKEADLRRLKEAESTLSGFGGLGTTSWNGGGAARAVGGKTRIDWGTVLEQMPQQFKAGDIRKVRGLTEKRASEIFAAITRWIDGGSKKRERILERLKRIRELLRPSR
jgi:hypothetical protein